MGYSDAEIDRCLNHTAKKKKVQRTYNRHVYRLENAAIWTKVAGVIMAVIKDKSANVGSVEAARLKRNAS